MANLLTAALTIEGTRPLLFHAIRWDKTVVSRGELEAVAINASRLVGVGSGRAIGFGRFELRAFTIADEPA